MDELEQQSLCDVRPEYLKQRANNITVLFVGDSLNFQMFASAVLQYGDTLSDSSEGNQVNRRGHAEAKLCSGKIRLQYIRNDYLTENGCGTTGTCLDFWDFAASADVLLFNRGAHVLSDKQTKEQMYHFVSKLTFLEDINLSLNIYFTFFK